MPSMAKRGLVRRTVRRLVKKLVGFFRGGAEVVHVLFVPLGSDSLITSEGETFKVVE